MVDFWMLLVKYKVLVNAQQYQYKKLVPMKNAKQ